MIHVPRLLPRVGLALCAFVSTPGIAGADGPEPVPVPLAPRPEPTPGDEEVPAWVRTGARMTYSSTTGTLQNLVHGCVLDEQGEWVLEGTTSPVTSQPMSASSEGLLQATVVGIDGTTAALAKRLYRFDGAKRTPVLDRSFDQLVTPDGGEAFWMHPRRQARVRADHPWGPAVRDGQVVARSVPWTVAGETYQATFIARLGVGTRTTHVFDQATGRLLTLRSVTRGVSWSPDLNLPSGDPFSEVTVLEYRGGRQLRLPWLDGPEPSWAKTVSTISYRGSLIQESPGQTSTSRALSDDVTITRRGPGWRLLRVRSTREGALAPYEADFVDGAGSLPPLCIAPEVLALLTVGQVIDRDLETGVTLQVASSDAESVTFRAGTGLESYAYVYARENGTLTRRVNRRVGSDTPGAVWIRDVSLTGWR